VAIQDWGHEGSILFERHDTEPGPFNGNRLAVYECDRNGRAAHALAGESRQAVLDGISEQAIESSIWEVIKSTVCIKQIMLECDPHQRAPR